MGHQHAGYSNHKIHGLNGSTQLTELFRFGGQECTGLEEKSEAWVDWLIQKIISADFDDFDDIDDFCMLLSALPVCQVCQQAVCPVDCSLSEWPFSLESFHEVWLMQVVTFIAFGSAQANSLIGMIGVAAPKPAVVAGRPVANFQSSIVG